MKRIIPRHYFSRLCYSHYYILPLQAHSVTNYSTMSHLMAYGRARFVELLWKKLSVWQSVEGRFKPTKTITQNSSTLKPQSLLRFCRITERPSGIAETTQNHFPNRASKLKPLMTPRTSQSDISRDGKGFRCYVFVNLRFAKISNAIS